MPTLYVDADACPVKDIIERAALRMGFPVFFVSNRPVGIRPKKGVMVILAPAGPDEADRMIAERCGPGDLVLTADLPLAAAALANGSRCIDFRGDAFDAGTIDGKLAAREMNETLRGGFTFTGGPAPMTQRDRMRFANTF
ncbi:MAG: DUF188 domain-containing protein, partial [Myxococcota bacterium]